MVSAILSRLVILVFGTLYPAYASYKAVRTKNVKEYVKWMMYWIVFALFCAVETFSDFFLSWFPFYYEFKIIFVLWMLSPMTQGSSFLFKKFVHPQLARREKDIDEMIEQATKQGYSAFVDLGNKGFKVILKSVIMGQSKLVDHLRRSYSTSDLSNDGQELAQHHEAIGDKEEDGEDELDNRLLEDQAELAKRSKAHVVKSKSSTAAVLLSSVKEEGGGEDGNHTISESLNVTANTRRSYSMREEKSATRQQRCQSLPPFADRYAKPLIIASTNLESKRQFFAKLQSVEKKEIVSHPSVQIPSSKDPKRYVLTRSLSQDSGTLKKPSHMSLFSKNYGSKSGGSDLVKTLTESKDITNSEESNLIVYDSEGTAQTHPTEVAFSVDKSPQQGRKSKSETDVLLEQEISMEAEEIRTSATRRSVPRFWNDLPSIDEIVPLETAPEEVLKELSANPQNQGDSELLLLHGESAEGLIFNDSILSDFSEDHSDLIFLNVEEDSDDQCPTPVAKNSPPSLSEDDEKKDAALESELCSEINIRDGGSVNAESDAGSLSQFGSLSSIETYSEESDSNAWETLSEASAPDPEDKLSEIKEATTNLKDEPRPWSAPSSPASFIRGSKYEDYDLHSVNTSDSQPVQTRNLDKSEFTWMKSKVQRQMTVPSASPRGIIYSWPYSSHTSDAVNTSQTRERLAYKSHGYSYDPFQTWHPPSRSGATSHQRHSIASSASVLSSRTLSLLSDRSGHPYVRSSSLDLGGGEAMYGRYMERTYKTNPVSSQTHSLLGSSSHSMRRFSTSTSSHYPSRTYQSYTSKKY